VGHEEAIPNRAANMRKPAALPEENALEWLAQDDPRAAAAALEPVWDGPVPVNWRTWLA
jgi:hypothetical protein